VNGARLEYVGACGNCGARTKMTMHHVHDLPDEAWTKFEKTILEQATVESIMELADGQATREQAQAILDEQNSCEAFINSIYQVNIYRRPSTVADGPDMIWLSIKRRDKKAVHDWRHFQRIKNELVGPEFEGAELYPAESRLADCANQYHVWVVADPNFRFPFGFDSRMVVTDDHDGKFKQRGIK
jgi:hypothetical protein